MHEGPEVGMRDGGGEGGEEARGGAREEGGQVRERGGVHPRCEAAVHLRWGLGVRVQGVKFRGQGEMMLHSPCRRAAVYLRWGMVVGFGFKV